MTTNNNNGDQGAGRENLLPRTPNPEPYNACLRAMYSLRRFGIILGLDVIAAMLEGLGNPHRGFKSIHVAGTNGKGSVCSALATILHAAGCKVGLYTSPHLVKFNERICIDGQPISDDEVVQAYEAVKDVPCGNREPTFFEYSTAMAFYEFGRQKVDWAVIETGMGGRMDATNIITPAVSVITNISLEHQMYLGSTVPQITAEKGGIIKQGIPVVTGVTQKSAVSVLNAIAREKSADIYRLGENFRVRRNKKNGTFVYFGIEQDWQKMRTGLSGHYQADNAALVLAACEILNKNRVRLSEELIRTGLEQNRWPGRLEKVSDSPLILLDGAHNLAAARNLARFLAQELGDRKITLLIGILDDKPYEAMLRELVPVCHSLVITRPQIERSMEPEILCAAAKKMIGDVKIIPDVGEAIIYCIKTVSPHDAVCIAGSLYVVGEAKAFFGKTDLTYRF